MMPLSEILFLGIVLYLLYRFVFNFLVPVMRTTKEVRRQFRDMQDNMQGRSGPGEPFKHQATGRPEQPKAAPKQTPPKNSMGEYIDFEEIK